MPAPEPRHWSRNSLRLAARLAAAWRDRLLRQSAAVAGFLQDRMVLVLLLWLLFIVPLCLLRLYSTPSPIHSLADAAPILLAYAAIIAAPACGYWVGHGAFARKETRGQPRFRWAVYGKWRDLGEDEAQAHPDYGPFGVLVSLLVGLLLNVVMRAGEFFLATPAVGLHAPDWALALFLLMAADVAIFGFFYMVAFAMAMRPVPLFPRMLLFIWAIDVLMQLLIARQLAAVGNVPPGAVASLIALLQGNIYKVLVSVLVWLPYLLLSQRVNVTYRHRLAARGEASGE